MATTDKTEQEENATEAGWGDNVPVVRGNPEQVAALDTLRSGDIEEWPFNVGTNPESPVSFADLTLPVIATEDILEKNVVFWDFNMNEGEDGEYAVVTVEPTPTSGKAIWTCGGKVVIEKLHSAKENGMFPLIGLVAKVGSGTKFYYDLT